MHERIHTKFMMTSIEYQKQIINVTKLSVNSNILIPREI